MTLYGFFQKNGPDHSSILEGVCTCGKLWSKVSRGLPILHGWLNIAILPWNLMVGRPRMALPNAFVSSLKVSLLSIINYNQIFSFPSKSHLTISFCQDSGIIKRWIVFLGKLACMCTESLGRKTNSCQCCICWRWISWDPRNKTYVFYMCISLRSDRYFLLASGLCDLKKYVGIIFRPRRSS